MLGASAASRTEKVTTVPGFRSEASSLVALRTAIDLGEKLAVFGAVAPAAFDTALVAGFAFPFRSGEVVNVDVGSVGACDNFFPVDGFHMTEIVIVEHAYTPGENI